MFEIFVPDILHDWDIGVGKQLEIHLFRILESIDPGLLTELDRR